MTSQDPQAKQGNSLIDKARGAFLGAAFGDALGWPQEKHLKIVSGQGKAGDSSLPSLGLRQWIRRDGGRYFSHEEVILAGEYSDDTQLLLSVARSLLSGQQWWRAFVARELPLWTLYERGGGSSTKRAADAWAVGSRPWSSVDEDKRRRYFEAGGNGVAMRISPHCLVGAREGDFKVVAKNIFAGGICTHGNPVALVGALAYGYAVWMAFREAGTLKYGALIDAVLSGTDSWSPLPDLADTQPDIWTMWRHAADTAHNGSYEEGWHHTVRQMIRLFELCRTAMGQGALSIDHEVLGGMGCFNPRVSGAGTVAAAASIFLASRYAAEPSHGLLEAAFAHGADTDTLASMTAGLLGAVLGAEWLTDQIGRIQDAPYMEELSKSLLDFGRASGNQTAPPVQGIKKKNLESLVERLKASRIGDRALLPDGSEVRVLAQQELRSRSKTVQVISRKLAIFNGQTVYIKAISRTNDTKAHLAEPRRAQRAVTGLIESQPDNVLRIGLRLPVADLTKARCFYEKVLGIKVVRESNSVVNLGDIIALVLPHGSQVSSKSKVAVPSMGSPSVYVEMRSLDTVYANACNSDVRVLTKLTASTGRRFFRCLDPDNNVVEIVEISEVPESILVNSDRKVSQEPA